MYIRTIDRPAGVVDEDEGGMAALEDAEAAAHAVGLAIDAWDEAEAGFGDFDFLGRGDEDDREGEGEGGDGWGRQRRRKWMKGGGG